MVGISINRFGLTEVASADSAAVDIVFVHGLNGDPHNTWTSEKSKTFWPGQLLPPVLEEEKARVLVYGYDADVTSFTDGASKDKIHNHAEHLVAELAANRRIRKATERPIIFVAHSLGGLVVKRALIHSSEIRGQKTEHLRSIWVSAYGILFLGTPHKGSEVAQWGSRLEWICNAVLPKKVLDSQPQLVDALKKENETLQNIDRQFIQLMGKLHVFFFHEAKPTSLKGTLRFVVDEESAAPTVQDVERAAIQADHRHMCKFENESSPGFDLVVEAIQRYADEAPEAIKRNWSSEEQERMISRRAAAEALVPESARITPKSDANSTFTSNTGNSPYNQSSSSHASLRPDVKAEIGQATTNPPEKPSEPYFIVPPGFRANAFFVGMEKELKELDRGLFDKRRQIGTAAVLLYGQAGVGKSHLARQYVHKNRKRFEGGIFWITAKLREERYSAYWAIYQKVVSREAPEMCTNTQRPYVDTVKTWFEEKQKWLIVFDGLTLEQDEEATELQSFIPDSKNSSIIYISRAKNLESKQRLLRPVAIRVGPLKEEDARKLLFKSLDEFKKKRPSDTDTKKATELVRKIGGLPLVIDAISHRIADTHEPLAKFNIKSYSANPKMAGTYNKILDDLQRLGYMEAWNLIHILCFFGQHIPVELINLGLKSLVHDGVNVKSSDAQSEAGGEPDLNTTFSILIRYALIERNEPDDNSGGSHSSSHDSLVGPDPIDVLKIHSVVQRFCCDSLNARKILPEWLGYAVRVFEYSYHQADVRIKQQPAPGRVSDYREYLTHGRRLLEHVHQYESKTQSLHDLKVYLQPILATIQEEIEVREPDSSSQESLTYRIQQVSIFDRTSSSSSSAPSGSSVRTPHRPSPLPLPSADENDFGFPLYKPSIDSPRSMGTLTPVPGGLRIVGQTLHARFPPFDDNPGYDTDREHPRAHTPLSIQHDRSDMTTRPRNNTTVSKESGWELVISGRKIRKTPKRQDLGTFRPTRAPAKTDVDRRHVAGSVSQPVEPIEPQKRPSLGAVQALSEVQNRSPPASSWSRTTSFWMLASPSRIANVLSGRQSYVSVVQKESHGTQTSSIVDERPPTKRTFIQPSGAENMERGRPDQKGPSPLAAGFVPEEQADGYNPDIVDCVYQSVPQPTGPNSAPLPLVENINVSYKRAFLSDYGPEGHYQTFSSSIPKPHSHTPYTTTRSQFSPPLVPAGYYSQPMSRNVSDRSHFSAAETEPAHYHPVFQPSPQSGIAMPYSGGEEIISPSPRDRLADGRPLRKSPKTMAYAQPVNVLQGTGAWTPIPTSSTRNTPPSSSTPLSNSAPPPRPPPAPYMSNLPRSSSSSGPGVAVETPSQGLGIVPFGPPSLTSPTNSSTSLSQLQQQQQQPQHLLQFGDHAPISLEEARRRQLAHEARLREREQEIQELRDMADDVEMERERMRRMMGRSGERESEARGGAPYPAVDLMPP